jgi:DNA mismatch repair ATPase MutS
VFLSVFPSIFLLIPSSLWLGIVVTIIVVVVFLILVKIYNQQILKVKHIQALIKINDLEVKALNYQFDTFGPGNEFIDIAHPYSYDMDLFGEGSLFQFINRTVTHMGGKKLAQLFIKETKNADKIRKRQYALQELVLTPEIIQDFRATGNLNADSENDLEVLNDWIARPALYGTGIGMFFLTRVLPIVTIVSLVLAFIVPFMRAVVGILFLTQLTIVGVRFSNTSREHNKLNKRLEVLTKYHALFSIMERGNYSGDELSNLNLILNTGNTSAAVALNQLKKIVTAFDNRLNVLAAIFLEGFLLWDLQCMIRLEQWKKNYEKYFRSWIDALASFDSMVSLATFAFNHPKLTYPDISDTAILNAKQMGHILIPDNERICNDFNISDEGDFIIITGANMAGKSTFLRTVAVNVILAMAGAPVCAVSLSFRPMNLFSSMRTTDSLNRHESYFYAELRRLKEMLDRLRKGQRLFIILDEILKGTNSADKYKGSFAALHRILDLKGTGILATHDLDLAAIEKDYPDRIKNMCFEIEIDKAKISFDYKLRGGITTKMNALLLMRQMGIIGQ